MRERLLQARDATAAAYAAAMAAIKKATRGPVIPPTTRQEASTARLLAMDDEQLAKHKARALPEDYKAKPTGTFVEDEVDVEVGRRTVTPLEQLAYRMMQHSDDRNSVGQPELAHDEDFKERGVAAFMRAYGTGRYYGELRPDEKRRVCNYYLEGLSYLQSTAAAEAKRSAMVEAVSRGDDAAVDALLKEEVKTP